MYSIEEIENKIEDATNLYNKVAEQKAESEKAMQQLVGRIDVYQELLALAKKESENLQTKEKQSKT